MTMFWMCGKVLEKKTRKTRRGEYKVLLIEDGETRNRRFHDCSKFFVCVRLSQREFDAIEVGMLVLIDGTLQVGYNRKEKRFANVMVGQHVRVIQDKVKALAELVYAKQNEQRLKNYDANSKIKDREIPLKDYEKYTREK